jgi:hypothetical protein
VSFCVFQEAEMVLKNLVPVMFAGALLASGNVLAADDRPADFLTLDLSKAVFSKTPLGPPTQFAPVAVEAKGDRAGEPAWARNELKVEPKQVPIRTVRAAPPHRLSHVASVRRHGTARVKLAHRHHGDPMNAQAMDTRIQTWPCRSGGGICDWKR